MATGSGRGYGGSVIAESRRSRRDWVVDVVLFLLALPFAVGVAFLPSDVPKGDFTWSWHLGLGVMTCLTLWWRRRWPVQLALAVAATSFLGVTSAVVMPIMVFTVAVHRSARVAMLVGALSVLISFFLFAVRDGNGQIGGLWSATVLAFSLLSTAAIVGWGMLVRARRELVASLKDRAERAEAEQQLRVGQARQLERTRIAREMHDVLAHRISLVSMHAGALEYRAEAVGGEVARSAAVIRSSAHQALEDLREVIGVLRAESDDAEMRPQPTLNDLRALVEESLQAGMRVTCEFGLDDTGASVPLRAGRTAYRIVQEGLTNARKHAPDSVVVVRLSGGPGTGLSVEVLSRRAVGVRAGGQIPGAGLGLIGLKERADLSGGRLEHGHTGNGDFRLAAWLPWLT